MKSEHPGPSSFNALLLRLTTTLKKFGGTSVEVTQNAARILANEVERKSTLTQLKIFLSYENKKENNEDT